MSSDHSGNADPDKAKLVTSPSCLIVSEHEEINELPLAFTNLLIFASVVKHGHKSEHHDTEAVSKENVDAHEDENEWRGLELPAEAVLVGIIEWAEVERQELRLDVNDVE